LQAAYFESILKVALYAYTVYGAAVTPAVMAVFFWKRANTAGAICSILAGTVITVVWNVMEIQWMEAVYPALGVSLAALIGVSLATAPPPKEKWEPFFK
jgi:solute:Na+ symporter, SSS family